MTQESQTSSASKRGIGRGMPPQRQDHEDNSGGHTKPFKRTSMVGIRIYQDEDVFIILNPGYPSRRVISSSEKVTKRSDIVTGDIGYTPRQGFKWKGKSAITNRNLERMRDKKVIQTRWMSVESTTEHHNITVDNTSTTSKEEEKVESISSEEWKNYPFEGFNISDEASKILTKLINDYSEWIANGLLKHHAGRLQESS
ncbi:hypothetical protein CQW23_16798 [Capsicum baccatum]|uniref:Uncharacterized protein n=1 Tax=Capsicum baccatum TaxID=33114 RepID=A0A2G2WBZ5_CAPBA|nr:hypothetical protein CQW23_16798 [Capsicum baccatum]